MAVLQTGNDDVLEVDTARECRQSCSNDTRSMPQAVDSILGLFKNGTSTIPILGNRQLNGYLVDSQWGFIYCSTAIKTRELFYFSAAISMGTQENLGLLTN